MKSEQYNGIKLRGDYVLEKEYEESKYPGINIVRYFVYKLEDNLRIEILPRLEKVDAIEITDCMYDSPYIYFSEYDDQYDGTYMFNIIRYNYIDGSWGKIYSYVDKISSYPDQKKVKVFILNETNLIIEQALPVSNKQNNYIGYFNYTLYLVNTTDGKYMQIADENLCNNGIDCMIPYAENMCILKTGFSLLADERYTLYEREEVSVESINLINIQQFISDLLLQQPAVIMNTIEQACYDYTIPYVKAEDNYIIYSKLNCESYEETITFYNYETKRTTTCLNSNVKSVEDLLETYIINGFPFIKLYRNDNIQFYNIEANEIELEFPQDTDIKCVTNNMIILTESKHAFLGINKNYICLYKIPGMTMLHQEKGEFLGCVETDDNTAFIFIK
ncbi:MAG: hypothetical protein ACI4DS_03495 [Eubacterium sp.]